METHCWIARGKPTSEGYGKVSINNKREYAHRVSYQLFKGKILAGFQIDHLCRNRMCINPEHLELVTSKENTLRGESLQALNAEKTHCIRGHKLDGDNLDKSSLKNGVRRCKECLRMHWRRYNKTRPH